MLQKLKRALIKKFNFKHKKQRFFLSIALGFLLVLLTIIPIRLAIALVRSPSPQAILMLGGGLYREDFTARFAREHPNLEIWISGGKHPDKAYQIFQNAGIPKAQVHVDCRAIDTVTNFTALVDDFSNKNLEHLYLITADFHMPRAKAIATLVLGSRGIAVTPVPMNDRVVYVRHEPESWHRTMRDVFRSILWLTTGRTGASLRKSSLTSCSYN